MRISVIFVLVILLVSAAAPAGVPPMMNYQGILADAAGLAVADGPYVLSFRLYDAPSGGDLLWEEERAVEVSKGIFNVLLGEVAPMELPFDQPYWIGISVEGEAELAPRIFLASSAYSFMSRTVQDSTITDTKIAGGTVVRSLNGLRDDVSILPGTNVSIDQAGQEIVISATGGGGGVSGSAAAGQVAFWDGTSSVTGDNSLFWDDTLKRLGVGTSSPNARMRVESGESRTAVIASTLASDTTQALRAMVLGSGQVDAEAVFAQSIMDDGYGTGGHFVGGERGVYGVVIGGDHSGDVAGVYGEASGTSQAGEPVGAKRCGVYGTAYGPGSDISLYGVFGAADGSTYDDHYGVYGQSQEVAGTRVGVYGSATVSGAGYRYGVVGNGAGGDESYGVFSSGDLAYLGNLISLSDGRVKEDLRPVEGALERIMRLGASSFSYSTRPEHAWLHMSPGTRYGFVAQEIEDVFPELVKNVVPPVDPEDLENRAHRNTVLKGVDYVQLIPVLVRAIQEQQDTIDELKREIAGLKEK